MIPIAFTSPAEIASLTAKALLDIKAVLFNAEKPFIFTSGWASPVYIDCRLIMSYPDVRAMVANFAVSTLFTNIPFGTIDSIVGGETAGIAYAAWIADRMGLPMQYVRKQPKGFGRMAQIEGVLPEGNRIVLVEDLATDGKSKMAFAQALRNAGIICNDVFAFFYYKIYEKAEAELKENGITMHYLCTWWDVLEKAKAENRFDNKTLTEVETYLHDPISWSARHGGRGSEENPIVANVS